MTIIFADIWWKLLEKSPRAVRIFIGGNGRKALPMALLLIIMGAMLWADSFLAIRIPAPIFFALLSFACALWVRAYMLRRGNLQRES